MQPQQGGSLKRRAVSPPAPPLGLLPTSAVAVPGPTFGACQQPLAYPAPAGPSQPFYPPQYGASPSTPCQQVRLALRSCTACDLRSFGTQLLTGTVA